MTIDRDKAWESVKWIVKYSPLVMTSLLMGHCILLIHGHDDVVIRFVCGAGLWSTITMYFLSHVCKFCWAHRLCIIYCGIIDFCMEFEKYHLFGRMLHINVNYARAFMFILGLASIICVIRRIKKGTI